MTPSAVTVDEIRTLAKLAGLEVAPDALALLAERISGVRAQLAMIPDAALAKVEPALVLPLATRSGA